LSRDNKQLKDVVVLGAGLAGLAAGCVLSRSGMDILLLERDCAVGGLAKTLAYGGFRFDLGGHRFITNNKNVEHFVKKALRGKLFVVNRSSKILLRGKYFDYPLQPWNAFFGLGIGTTTRIVLDYILEQLKGRRSDDKIVSLEDWVVRHFGRTLFNIYFKEYSEKIWGIDCSRICMEWVAQRIQGLSLATAIKRAFLKSSDKDARTLASKFLYPPLGIGQIGENLREEIEKNNTVLTGAQIVRINHVDDSIKSVTVQQGGEIFVCAGSEFVSSIPLTTLIELLHPKPPSEVRNAASRLRYRDLVIVAIMVNRTRVTDQTWIYIPEKKIPFGRIHEPTNWSENMAPQGKTLVVTEHFCFRGDATWKASDEELTESTIANLVNLRFIKRHEVINRVVVRIPRAYPLFEVGYVEHYRTICGYLGRYSNLHPIGRGGLFKYYNMDHAIASGIAAAEEILLRDVGSAGVFDDRLAPTGTHS
jgi:protoporphyrinogen oxidase